MGSDKNGQPLTDILKSSLPEVGTGYVDAADIAALDEKSVQVCVPGRQMTLAHVIAAPREIIYEKLSLEPDPKHLGEWAIGIMKFTPWETALVAADIATDASAVKIGFVDRFVGCLVITGYLVNVETALDEVRSYCRDTLGFSVPPLTRS